VRCPENFKHCFFQRHFTASTPKALKSIAIESHEKTADYIYLDNKEGLLSLVQMGILEIHPWGSLINNIENPDFIVFDLDPAPDVDWSIMVMAAREIKTYLEQYQLISFIKTTGGKGLHIVIPIQPEYSWDAVKNFTHVFVEFLEKTNPQRYISIMAKNKRQGKIFVDYLRNQRSATAIAPYSTRARIHAPVSVPIHWDELSPDRRDIDFTIKNVVSRLDNLKTDPWQDFRKIKQSLGLDKLK
jgi:bifunctional non-homologous end joining protein LigD